MQWVPTRSPRIKAVRLDDGPFGNGAGGQLLPVRSAGRRLETIWLVSQAPIAAAAQARRSSLALLADPLLRSPRRSLPAAELAGMRSSTCRATASGGGGRLGQAEHRGPDPDRERPADPLGRPGQAVPGAGHEAVTSELVGAGYPDYPWMFATDAEYTAFAAVPVGQFDAIKEHLRALREISDVLNDRCGMVAHEVVRTAPCGGTLAHTDPDGTSYDFNTDETVKFPSAVALVWRWTGETRFLDAIYDFSVRNLRFVTDRSTPTTTGCPKDSATSSAPAWARRSSTTPSTTSAASTTWPTWHVAMRDAPPGWATGLAVRVRDRASTDLVDRAEPAIRGLAGRPQCPVFQQKHWIGETPMEAELSVGGPLVPGLAPPAWPPPSPSARSTATAGPAVQPRVVPHRLRRWPERAARTYLWLTTS